MLQLGVYTRGIDYSYEELRDLWQTAERCGFDSAWTMDNSVAPFIGYPETPVYDPFVILPALAEATNRIRFGPLVSPCGRRHPALFAKMTSVLDVMSGGRLELAMGCGDHPQFFEPWGMSFPKRASERIAILREELEVIRLMWTQDEATFRGRHYTLDRAINFPKPVQRPHPPIWIGIVHGRKLLPRLAAEMAEGVNTIIASDDEAVATLEAVKDACRESGRDYETLGRSRHLLVTFAEPSYDFSRMVELQADREGRDRNYVDGFLRSYRGYFRHIVGSPEQVAHDLMTQAELGFTTLILQFTDPDLPLGGGAESVLESVETFATEVMPTVRNP